MQEYQCVASITSSGVTDEEIWSLVRVDNILTVPFDGAREAAPAMLRKPEPAAPINDCHRNRRSNGDLQTRHIAEGSVQLSSLPCDIRDLCQPFLQLVYHCIHFSSQIPS